MKARIVFAAVFALSLAPPAGAQNTAAPAQNTVVPAQNPPADLVGPPQLRDFTLNGTVTRRPTEPAAQPPAARQPAQRPATTAPATREQPQSPAPSRDTGTQTRDSAPAATPQQPTLPAQTGTTPQLFPEPGGAAPFDDVTAPAPAQGASSDGALPPMLPWLAAALGLGGVAAWFFLRQRPRRSYAGGPGETRFEIAPDHSAAPPPEPVSDAAPVAPPAPTPATRLGPGGTIVSTKLRPWLEIEFTPRATIVEDAGVGVEFDVAVFNSGSVPARDVLVEARLLNAGPDHLEALRRFYMEPVAQGSRVPVIEPMKRIKVANAVLLRREHLTPIEVDGRQLLVPLVAFNALYSWAGGNGQTSASYIVGKPTEGEKLAPFRLDAGAKTFAKVAAREHDMRIRT